MNIFIMILLFIIVFIFTLYKIHIDNKLKKMDKRIVIMDRDLEIILNYTYKVEFVRADDSSMGYNYFTSLKDVSEYCLINDIYFEIKKIINIKTGETISQQTKQSKNTEILKELKSRMEEGS